MTIAGKTNGEIINRILIFLDRLLTKSVHRQTIFMKARSNSIKSTHPFIIFTPAVREVAAPISIVTS